MDLLIVGADAAQQAAVERVVHDLLNLPFEIIPLEWRVDFVADPTSALHNEFAITEYEYDSKKAFTRVRSDMPGAPEPWAGMRFLQETIAHELGHALFALIPHELRTKVAELFGAKSDDLSELQPESPWEQRIIEGIAETFKDAFLPQRYRRYFNRTTHKIDISDYPTFRRYFREGMATASIGTQMIELPIVDELHTVENPLAHGWVKWPAAEHIGCVRSGPSTTGYSSPALSGTPRMVGAIYTGNHQENRFGVVARIHNQWDVDMDGGSVQVFAAADGSGNGYRLIGVRTELHPQPANDLYDLTLERWVNGSLSEVLLDSPNTSIQAGGEIGISVFDGKVAIWARTVGELLSKRGEVSDDTFSSGYGGVGVERDNAFSSNSLPQMDRFRIGELVQGEIVIPDPGVGADGFVRGSRPSGRPVVGSTG